MATHKKSTIDEMKKNDTHPAPAADNEGWSDYSRWDFDGFWKPEPQEFMQGTCVEVRAIRDAKKKVKLVYVFKLDQPARVMRDGVVEEAKAGEVIGCGESYGLRSLREIVGGLKNPTVRIRALEKKDIGGGQSMWTFRVQARGGTPRKAPLNFAAILAEPRHAKGAPEPSSNGASDDADDYGDTSDDIPF